MLVSERVDKQSKQSVADVDQGGVSTTQKKSDGTPNMRRATTVKPDVVKHTFNIKRLALDSLSNFKKGIQETAKQIQEKTTDAKSSPDKPPISFKNATDNVLKAFMEQQTILNAKQAEIKKEEIEAIKEEIARQEDSESDYDTEINDNVSDVPVNVELTAQSPVSVAPMVEEQVQEQPAKVEPAELKQSKQSVQKSTHSDKQEMLEMSKLQDSKESSA